MTVMQENTLCVCGDAHCKIGYGFCHCGCGRNVTCPKQTRTRGNYRKGVPHIYLLNHSPAARERARHIPRTAAPTLLHYPWGIPKYRISANGCWDWIAWKNPKGYGVVVGDNKRKLYAHRVSWKLAGRDIPEGFVLDHKCHNKSCVNPAHLQVTTIAGNVRRKLVMKLSGADAAQIRQLHADGMLVRRIAARYGISESFASRVCSGKKWGPRLEVLEPLEEIA